MARKDFTRNSRLLVERSAQLDQELGRELSSKATPHFFASGAAPVSCRHEEGIVPPIGAGHAGNGAVPAGSCSDVA